MIQDKLVLKIVPNILGVRVNTRYISCTSGGFYDPRQACFKDCP